MRNYAAEAEALMLELVAHPGGVADALRILGVRGRPAMACRCPVAVYLTRATGLSFGRVGVHDTWVSIRFPGGEDGQEAQVVMAQGVRGFTDRFDNGAYRELLS